MADDRCTSRERDRSSVHGDLMNGIEVDNTDTIGHLDIASYEDYIKYRKMKKLSNKSNKSEKREILHPLQFSDIMIEDPVTSVSTTSIPTINGGSDEQDMLSTPGDESTSIFGGVVFLFDRSKELVKTTVTSSVQLVQSTAHIGSRIGLQVGHGIGTQYARRVPDPIKDTINSSSNALVNTVVKTSNLVTTKSAKLIDISIKPAVYNGTVGYFYTQELTRLLLQDIPENSTILDIGIGTCYSYCQNADIIKERNIRIVGIDIDEAYILTAKHALIDARLEDWIELMCIDIYITDLDKRTFDYVVFSDSYSVISNVNNMLRYCERFMNRVGYMIITSTLFDTYHQNVDFIKQNLKYVSIVEYGTMMLKQDLETYIIEDRHSDDYEFKLVKTMSVGKLCDFKSYIVRWRPIKIDL
jgi:ubiquinone/menaquinone biosynthesis C-methylase UbiE